ncbi:2-phospho-L-lactate transferase CofD family protein [Caldicellulosiruptor bescii]|uniref:2-phospho-L-lactate transferase CofD family protein n=1 Tax=Caldicellulosiruptor bescii TaxID=31899 RepID=UPI002117F399|nr:2-phospho-L-lactate transferase CofD family protein [Caldicellulosiruptor bescii]
MFKEVVESIKKSRAKKIYVANIMTQPGETDGYLLCDHIEAIERHCGGRIFDMLL